jgi:alkylated DNA nucleotide flippase Atl1
MRPEEGFWMSCGDNARVVGYSAKRRMGVKMVEVESRLSCVRVLETAASGGIV